MMDKTERIIDMTEHPERYSEDELRKMLIDDDEGSRIYRTIAELNVALSFEETSKSDNKKAGMGLSAHWNKPGFINKTAAVIVAICLISGITYAAVALIHHPSTPEKTETVAPALSQSTSTPVPGKSASSVRVPIVKTYEDASLATIVSDIAATFDKQQAYRSDKAKTLRLYFRLDTRRGIEKNIEELNTFENINIEIKGDTIVVD